MAESVCRRTRALPPGLICCRKSQTIPCTEEIKRLIASRVKAQGEKKGFEEQRTLTDREHAGRLTESRRVSGRRGGSPLQLCNFAVRAAPLRGPRAEQLAHQKSGLKASNLFAHDLLSILKRISSQGGPLGGHLARVLRRALYI